MSYQEFNRHHGVSQMRGPTYFLLNIYCRISNLPLIFRYIGVVHPYYANRRFSLAPPSRNACAAANLDFYRILGYTFAVLVFSFIYSIPHFMEYEIGNDYVQAVIDPTTHYYTSSFWILMSTAMQVNPMLAIRWLSGPTSVPAPPTARSTPSTWTSSSEYSSQ